MNKSIITILLIYLLCWTAGYSGTVSPWKEIGIYNQYIYKDKYKDGYENIFQAKKQSHGLLYRHNISKYTSFSLMFGFNKLQLDYELWKEKYNGPGLGMDFSKSIMDIEKFKLNVIVNFSIEAVQFGREYVTGNYQNHNILDPVDNISDTITLEVRPIMYNFRSYIKFKSKMYDNEPYWGIEYYNSNIDFQFKQSGGIKKYDNVKNELKTKDNMGVFAGNSARLNRFWTLDFSFHFLNRQYFELSITYR